MLGVFDIGGTGYRTAISDNNQGLDKLTHGETSKGYSEGVLRLIEDLKKSGANQKFERIAGCIAGIIDKKTGVLIRSPNLLDWEGKLIQKDLQMAFGCEILLENDAAAEGLGEAVMGAGRGFSQVGFFCVGTGIGGAIINVQNSIFSIQSIEPGWTYKIGDKFLEEVAGGKAMEEIYGIKPEEITDLEIWRKEAEYLAWGINQIIVNWRPEIVVLGGSIFKSIDLDYLKSLMGSETKIEKGKLSQEAGLWGCLALLGQSKGQN